MLQVGDISKWSGNVLKQRLARYWIYTHYSLKVSVIDI